MNVSPCVVEHSLATKHLARQRVLRDDFVHRGREVDLRGRADHRRGACMNDERVSDNLELFSPTASFLPKGVGLN